MEHNIKEVNSIFEQPWWWDAVTNHNWECLQVENGEGVIARLPYFISKRFGQKIITMPPLTQTTGPWIQPQQGKAINRLAKRKKILYELIDKIPENISVDICLDSANDYILPFRWKGFHYEPTFSYRIDDLSDIEKLFSAFKDSVRRACRKAEKQLRVITDSSLENLFMVQDKTFQRQNRKNPYSRDLILCLDEACLQHKARKILVTIDENNKVHGAAYFVYDRNTCYYLMGGADPDLRSSGAQSLLLWEGIKFASTVSRHFDFEGSNIEDIEKFFSAFTADFVVNYRIMKLNPVLSFTDYLKPKIKQILNYKI